MQFCKMKTLGLTKQQSIVFGAAGFNLILRYEALWESAQANVNPMNNEEAGSIIGIEPRCVT